MTLASRRLSAVLSLAFAAFAAFAVTASAQTATPALNWVHQSLSNGPGSRTEAMMTYDAARGQIVLFGGVSPVGSGYLNDTWTYDGKAWTIHNPATSPAGRIDGVMAYDDAIQKVVLFSGGTSTGIYDDTWTWDGTNWTQLSPATSPGPRVVGSMAYDPAAGQLLLYGGINNVGGNLYNDTWYFNGTTWTQQSPANSPPAKIGVGIAFDTAINEMVTFGGYNYQNYVAGTWLYNGTTWNQPAPANNPPERSEMGMAYNATTGLVTLFGGGNSNTAYLRDTWTFDGTNWTQQFPANQPLGREQETMAYNSATGQLVLFGGRTSSGIMADTWTYELSNIAATTPVGTAATQIPVNFVIQTAGTLPALFNVNVLTQGSPNLDFTLGTGSTCTGAVLAGQTCSVNVVFTPRYPGQRTGAVNLINSSGTVIATAPISGIGTGPLATFAPGAVNTLAGTGTAGYSASQDTGTTPATSALLNYPYAAVADDAGNLYIADTRNNRVREVFATTGNIATIAGTGTAGYVAAQDGGPATSAELSSPYGLALDGAGNLYIADNGNFRIRKVTAATGIITTVAGNGTNGYAASDEGGPAINAYLSYLVGIAADAAGNLYLTDSGNNRIAKVTAATGTINTVAGNLNAGYNAAQDGGPATSAELNAPSGVAVDAAGNLYIADTNNYRIRKVTAATGIITTVAGNGSTAYQNGVSATSSGLKQPADVAVDAAGNIYISDTQNYGIRKVDANGIITNIAGNGTFGALPKQGQAATTAAIYPYGLRLDPAGNLYVSDTGNQIIRKITATAAPIAFANTAIGSTSTVYSVTMNNIGNATLTVPQPSTGMNPSLSTPFNLASGSNCPAAYATSGSAATFTSGANCVLNFTYPPTMSGATSGYLLYTDNNLNAAGSTQQLRMAGSTSTAFTVQVIGQNVPSGTASVSLEFIVGYSATAVPTATPTLKVDGSSTNVGAMTCTVKPLHNTCFVAYNTSTLSGGAHTITVTQPGDTNYTTTTATAVLTITGASVGRITTGQLQTIAAPAATRSQPSAPGLALATPTRITTTSSFAPTPYVVTPVISTSTDDATTATPCSTTITTNCKDTTPR